MTRSKKHQQLLTCARDLFWRFGFRRVTVEELCQEAGISKMTFYRHYQDKIALARTVFELEVDKGMHLFENLMLSDLGPNEKIAGMLQQKSEAVNALSKEFLQDFYQSDDIDLKQFISAKTDESRQRIVMIFKEAQQKGAFRKDFKPEFLLYISQKLVDNLTDPYLIELCGSQQEVIMELTRLFSYGILNRSEK